MTHSLAMFILWKIIQILNCRLLKKMAKIWQCVTRIISDLRLDAIRQLLYAVGPWTAGCQHQAKPSFIWLPPPLLLFILLSFLDGISCLQIWLAVCLCLYSLFLLTLHSLLFCNEAVWTISACTRQPLSSLRLMNRPGSPDTKYLSRSSFFIPLCAAHKRHIMPSIAIAMRKMACRLTYSHR